MFTRNIQKAISPLATTSRSAAFQPGIRRLTFSTSRTVPRSGTPKLCRSQVCTRRIGTSAPERPSQVSDGTSDVRWLNSLESISQASWLSSTPRSHEDILRRTYVLVFSMILYLSRPMSNDPMESQTASTNFLMLFTSAPVRSDSEIGRARYAIAIITKQLTKDFSSIPRSSIIRTKHSAIFTLAADLESPCDVYLEQLVQNKPPLTGEIVEVGKWHDFWEKVQPPILALGEALDKAGFGLPEDMLKEKKGKRQAKRTK